MSDHSIPSVPPIPPRPDIASPAMPVPPAPVGDADRDGTRPAATWRWWEAFLVFMGGALLAGLLVVVVTPVLSETTGVLVAGILGELVPLGALIVWLQVLHKGWMRVVGFPTRASWPREAGWGMLGGIAIYALGAIAIGTILTLLFQALSGGSVQTPEQLPSSMDPVQVVLAAFLAIVAAPVTEEFFFRGLFFRSIRSRNPYWVAAVWSSLLFGLAHFAPDPAAGPAGAWLLVATMFFVGFGLSFVYERRGNIVASMVAHAAFNVIGFLAILFLT
jgi:membrane protease YdiL (CAAX protease family)